MADGQRFLEESVKTPSEREGECDPGDRAIIDREDQDGDGGKGDGNPLEGTKAFAQQHGSEENREQRVDVVTKRRIERVVGDDRPDIDAPIYGDE